MLTLSHVLTLTGKKIKLIGDNQIDPQVMIPMAAETTAMIFNFQARALHHAQEIIVSLNTSGISLPDKQYARKLKRVQRKAIKIIKKALRLMERDGNN